MTSLKTAARGYGSEHQRKRRVWARRIASGEPVSCARCGCPVLPGMLWDLGHVDGSGKSLYSGPEHQKCNRQTQLHGVKRQRGRKWAYAPRKVSRQW
jgi:hypothetical protein